MNYIKRHKLQLFFLVLIAILISEVLVYLQLKLFWSDYDYNIGYWLGFWTPLIDVIIIMLLLIYLNNKNIKLLKNQKDRLQEIIDNSIDGIHIIDKKGNLFMFSPSFAKMLGYSFEEAKKLNIKDWDLSINDEFIKEIFKTDIGNQKLIYAKHTKKDSSIIDVEIFIKYIEIDNEKYIYATSRDLSKQIKLEKEIEAKNKKLQVSEEVLRDYVLFSKTDDKGIITDVSNAFCQLTGYTKKELLGKSHSILRHKDMNNSTYDELWNTIKNKKVWIGELKNLKKNGETYWVKATIKPEFDSDDNFIGYISIREDITDKKKFEKEHLLLLDQAKWQV